MKGTFISFDFVKDSDGSMKFVEMNTDTVASDRAIDGMNWNGLFEVMSGSDISQLDVIYKPELHQYIVNDLSASAITDGTVTTFNHHKEDLHANFPTAVSDSNDKFILRLAYDDNAIVDSIYCARGDEAFRLLNQYTSASMAVPFYVSGSDGEIDLLVTSSNAATQPDLVRKAKGDVFDNVKFYKVADWDQAKADFKEDYFLTSYLIHSSSVSNEAADSWRHYCIAYGGGLEHIDVGTNIQYAQFSLPTDNLAWSDQTENWQLPQKHYFEFSTSVPKIKNRREGVYATEKFVSASNDTPLVPSSIVSGQALKSYHIVGTPDTDDKAQYALWSHSGKELPSGSKVTSSVAVSNANSRPNHEGLVYELKPSGSTHPVYMGLDTFVITYNTGSDAYSYTSVQDIDENNDYIFNIDGDLVDIEYSNVVLLNSATGSFWTVDVEPVDHLVVDTDSTGDVAIPLVIHNFKKYQ